MRYVKAATRIVLVVSILVLAVFAVIKVPKRTYESIKVTAHTDNESVLVTQADVEKMIEDQGIEIIGKRIRDVDLTAVTELLEKNPYIAKINFVHSSGTRLLIDYTLRNIILHVYTADNEQYFVDSEGCLVPFTPRMQDYLIIANGHIRQPYKKGAAVANNWKSVFDVATKILADEFSRAQFRQVYLNEQGQIELVSTFGNQIVLLGNADNVEEKLENLKVVYREGLSRQGYETYALLDARYKNRIIAQRK